MVDAQWIGIAALTNILIHTYMYIGMSGSEAIKCTFKYQIDYVFWWKTV